LAAVAAAAGAVAARRYGSGAYQAALVAGVVNWLAGSASIAAVSSAKTRPGRVNAALGAMLLRMGLPFGVLLFLMRTGHPLVQNGVVGLMASLYLAGLAVETFISVRIVAAAEDSAHNGGPIKAN
jgi:hypothetical protein